MIFDADTHMSPYRKVDISISAEELRDHLQSVGIEKAVCWLMPQEVDDVSESNRYIYEKCKQIPMFVPFGWSNVREGIDKALSDAITCLDEYGFKGVKLNGAQNEYFIDSPEALRVCEQIAKRGKMIAFHIGTDYPNHTNPHRAAVVANEFPETPIVMIHMGGASTTEENVSRRVIDVAKSCPNMVLIGSAIKAKDVKVAIDELGSERVMFGSDMPFGDPAACIADYKQMLAEYDQTVVDNVLYKTAERVFLSK